MITNSWRIRQSFRQLKPNKINLQFLPFSSKILYFHQFSFFLNFSSVSPRFLKRPESQKMDLKKDLDEYLLLQSDQKKTFKLQMPSMQKPNLKGWFKKDEPNQDESWFQESKKSCCPTLVSISLLFISEANVKIRMFCRCKNFLLPNLNLPLYSQRCNGSWVSDCVYSWASCVFPFL